MEEEDGDYIQVDIQVEDNKSYQSSYVSNGDSIMSPSSWSLLNHHGGRGGRGRGSSSHHNSRGRGSSSHNHSGQQERPAVPGSTTQDQLKKLTRIQVNLRYHMFDLISKLG